ncbi:DUF4312 family protein [Brevibacillus humidisoli]|uniref:DUF4312 family protein n=1 Tax=Brevibacillus humidisoli TaxID=2895522 RepID=UPI001E3341EB|nr:DUF4312 family protein [Brevibacillus humidisoli]UFJ39104.1 DUF4312 family protein [Brevibacillus humidisoli]
MYKELIHSLTLSGSGETKEAAFNQIFGQIKKTIAREIPDLVVRIEPMQVDVLSAVMSSYTERFFGLFFPRTRIKYEIKAIVQVRLGLIELDKIEFKQKEHQVSTVQQLLRQG